MTRLGPPVPGMPGSSDRLDASAVPDGPCAGSRDGVPTAPRVLAITNLYPVPWDATRGVFNHQQFAWLSTAIHVELMVALPVREVVARPVSALRALFRGSPGRPRVRFFVYVNAPGPLGRLNGVLFFAALCMQRPVTTLLRRWDCLIGSWLFPDAVATAMVAALRGTPFVPIALGTDGNVLSGMPDRRAQIQWMLRRAHRVLTVSEALRTVLAERGAALERSEAVYTGVDPERFRLLPRGPARRDLALDPDALIVLFVGNIIPTKGVIELATATVELAAKDPRWMLVMIGAGPSSEAVTQVFEHAGLRGRLLMPGKVDHAALAPWFAAADVFCLPSYREGVPNVVLEAMACGVPVVASRVGGVPEVLPDHAGLMIEPRSVPAIVEALATCAERPWDRERIARHARGFSWQANADRLAEIVRSAMLDDARGGRR